MAISTIAIYFLWSDVLGNTTSLHGFTKKELVSYYVFIGIVVANTYKGLPLSQQIRDGTLASFLTKPISYIYYAYIHYISRISFSIVISLPIIALVYIFFHSELVIITQLSNYIYAAGFFILAVHILFFIEFLICSVEFWVMYSETIDLISDTVKAFFMGALIPLSFLPGIFSTLANILPYKYTGSFIIEAFMGRLSPPELLQGLLVSIIWIIGLFLFTLFVWNRGLRRFEAYGS